MSATGLLRNLATITSMTDGEIAHEIKAIETEDKIIRRRLSRIDDTAESLPAEEIDLLITLRARWQALNERCIELSEERSRRLWINVEKAAAEREKAENAGRQRTIGPTARHFGRRF